MIEDFKKDLQKIKNELEERIKTIRGYRLSLTFLENLTVEIYNQNFPLKSLGFLSQLDPLTFRFDPYDQNFLGEIEKSLSQRKQNFTLIKEKNSLLIKFPSLTEELRKEILKSLASLKEEIRIKARILRDEFFKKLREQKETKKISEDAFYKTKDNLDKAIQEFNNEVEEIFKQKEQEILG